MKQQNFDINKMRVASPCSVGWESMTGDERVRRCDSCELNIYNIAEMTKPEVENLVKTHEGRLCVRLFKRADGTVLTKDCPVGLRAFYKRTARFAGAALSAILGLFSVGFGETKDKHSDKNPNIKIVRTENIDKDSIIYGRIVDSAGQIIPGAKLKLSKKNSKKNVKLKSDSNGNFSFYGLAKGIYQLEIIYPNFDKLIVSDLEVKEKEKIRLDGVLNVESETVVVGIFAEEPLIDTNSSKVKTVITREMIDRIPH